MTELEWVDVDKVGGKKAWGDVTRLVIGRERERKITGKDGIEHTVTEKVTKITRLPNGGHVVLATFKIPEPEGEPAGG